MSHKFQVTRETVNFNGRSWKVYRLFRGAEWVQTARSQEVLAKTAYREGARLDNSSWPDCGTEKAVIQAAIEAGEDPRKPGTPLSLFARTLAGLEHDEKAKEAAPCEQ